MKILALPGPTARAITDYGSAGFTLTPLATGDSLLVGVRLAPHGHIGRHPAVGPQLLVVIEGEAIVSGSDGVEHTVRPGQAVVWESDEMHATRTVDGLMAVIIEGSLELIVPS